MRGEELTVSSLAKVGLWFTMQYIVIQLLAVQPTSTSRQGGRPSTLSQAAGRRGEASGASTEVSMNAEQQWFLEQVWPLRNWLLAIACFHASPSDAEDCLQQAFSQMLN